MVAFSQSIGIPVWLPKTRKPKPELRNIRPHKIGTRQRKQGLENQSSIKP